jgi:uncharacterized protein DUF7033
MLLVEHPAGYEPEREYVHGVVLSEMLGLPHRSRTSEGSDVRIRLADDPSGRVVELPEVLFGTPPDRWLTPSTLPDRPLERLPLGTEAGSPLPVLFGCSPPARAPIEVAGDVVKVAVDVFGSAFFMLTRYEELVRPERDDHGRFVARFSLLREEGILHRPIVNEYVELLWAALRHCWPRLRRKARSFQLLLTHDVDRPFAIEALTTATVMRQAAGDIVRRHEPGVALRRLRALGAARLGRAIHDPYDTFDFILSVSERHAVPSRFHFMAHDARDRLDPELDPPPLIGDPRLHDLMRRVHAAGHEVGFHPSYNTFRDIDRTRVEFTRLRETADRLGVRPERWGGRQHYLRWENPTTWRHLDEVGLDYDSSLGYADDIGFRSGVCDEYPAFDLQARRPLGIRELPLHVMDVAVFGTLDLSPPEALDRILEIMRGCREHAGPLVLLWHNNELASRRAKEWYRSLIGAIAG